MLYLLDLPNDSLDAIVLLWLRAGQSYWISPTCSQIKAAVKRVNDQLKTRGIVSTGYGSELALVFEQQKPTFDAERDFGRALDLLRRAVSKKLFQQKCYGRFLHPQELHEAPWQIVAHYTLTPLAKKLLIQTASYEAATAWLDKKSNSSWEADGVLNAHLARCGRLRLLEKVSMLPTLVGGMLSSICKSGFFSVTEVHAIVDCLLIPAAERGHTSVWEFVFDYIAKHAVSSPDSATDAPLSQVILQEPKLTKLMFFQARLWERVAASAAGPGPFIALMCSQKVVQGLQPTRCTFLAAKITQLAAITVSRSFSALNCSEASIKWLANTMHPHPYTRLNDWVAVAFPLGDSFFADATNSLFARHRMPFPTSPSFYAWIRLEATRQGGFFRPTVQYIMASESRTPHNRVLSNVVPANVHEALDTAADAHDPTTYTAYLGLLMVSALLVEQRHCEGEVTGVDRKRDSEFEHIQNVHAVYELVFFDSLSHSKTMQPAAEATVLFMRDGGLAHVRHSVAKTLDVHSCSVASGLLATMGANMCAHAAAYGDEKTYRWCQRPLSDGGIAFAPVPIADKDVEPLLTLALCGGNQFIVRDVFRRHLSSKEHGNALSRVTLALLLNVEGSFTLLEDYLHSCSDSSEVQEAIQRGFSPAKLRLLRSTTLSSYLRWVDGAHLSYLSTESPTGARGFGIDRQHRSGRWYSADPQLLGLSVRDWLYGCSEFDTTILDSP